MKRFVHRHEPHPQHFSGYLKAALGAAVAIAAASGLAVWTGLPFLIAPFGASAVLLFAMPGIPYSQPINVVGSYAVTALLMLGILYVCPWPWLAASIGVGCSIAAMQGLRVTHPPAGALAVLASSGTLSPLLLGVVAVVGSVILVAIAVICHALPPKVVYPRHLPEPVVENR